MADKEPIPLSVMLGTGEEFEVEEVVEKEGKKEHIKHKYKVLPLKLKEVDEFLKDNLSVGPQLFNLIDKESKKKVDKWLSRKVQTDAGEPVTLQMAYDHGWNLEDLQRCLRKLVGISG